MTRNTEMNITAYDFAQMNANPIAIVYKDNGSDIEFYGAFESATNAADVMRTLNRGNALYEMISYFVDTETCTNTYPYIDTIHFAYGVSDMVGLVPGGSFAAANIEAGDAAAEESAKKLNELLAGNTLPVFAGVSMKTTRIPFFRNPERKSQA